MATRVEDDLDAIEDPSEAEREQVRTALERLRDAPPWATPLQRRLLAAGLIETVADPRKRADHIRSFKPVKLGGEPISEQIIRERR